jgi:tetratricopeptide (TPR) repeat protein
MDLPSTDELLAALRDSDEDNRTAATAAFWYIWFNQKGEQGHRLLERCQIFIDQDRFDAAEDLLSQLINHFPDFAEAWNRRAVLYFLQERYGEAISDCRQVLDLVPYHFGALHGLGLCHAALGQYPEAIQAFQRALDIQPYATINQRLMLECMMQLS